MIGGARALLQPDGQQPLAATRLDGAAAQTLLDVASAQLLAGNLPAARQLVDRALKSSEYTQFVVQNEPWQARQGVSYQLIVAYTLMNTGAAQAGGVQLGNLSRLLDRLIHAGLERHEIYDLQAEVAAARGDLDGAMRSLGHAMELGTFNAWRAEHEPYLRPLKGRSDYRALIQRISEQNDRARKKIAAAEAAAASRI